MTRQNADATTQRDHTTTGAHDDDDRKTRRLDGTATRRRDNTKTRQRRRHDDREGGGLGLLVRSREAESKERERGELAGRKAKFLSPQHHGSSVGDGEVTPDQGVGCDELRIRSRVEEAWEMEIWNR